ncbi:MAG: hypothetical protein WCT10_01395 [Patescibacteria group bacterium]
MKKVAKKTAKKAKLVLHHDDPPCDERLDKDGFCPICLFFPDIQDTCFRFYCPSCKVLLPKGRKCPKCGQTFKRSGA